jgi:repressor LexA
MKGLTVRQREVLEFINGFIGRHKYPPSVRELAGHFAISLRGGYDHLKALRKKGFIRWSDGRSRALEVLDDGSPERPHAMVRVPLLGRVAAGVPVLAEESFEGAVGVSAELLGSGEHFALRVQGDSMRDAGILDGDTAIVRRQQHADNGDIVVVMIGEEAALKRFFLEANRVRLQAENPAYPTMFTRNLRILGKLRAVQRAYR